MILVIILSIFNPCYRIITGYLQPVSDTFCFPVILFGGGGGVLQCWDGTQGSYRRGKGFTGDPLPCFPVIYSRTDCSSTAQQKCITVDGDTPEECPPGLWVRRTTRRASRRKRVSRQMKQGIFYPEGRQGGLPGGPGRKPISSRAQNCWPQEEEQEAGSQGWHSRPLPWQPLYLNLEGRGSQFREMAVLLLLH